MAGLSPQAIRAAGRWCSEIYRIYCRVSRQAAAALGGVIGSTAFEDVEREAFVDEELTYTGAASATGYGFIEQELVAATVEDMDEEEAA